MRCHPPTTPNPPWGWNRVSFLPPSTLEIPREGVRKAEWRGGGGGGEVMINNHRRRRRKRGVGGGADIWLAAMLTGAVNGG